MKSIKKIILFGIIVLIIFSASCARTPQYSNRIDNGVASLETLVVNGDEQHLLIRGKNMNNPILLFLHGGPGMPMMYMAHEFQKKLEEDFMVVHWDQRSSGKSFKKDLSAETINVRQYLNDAKVVIENLRERFAGNKFILAGHSWGSYLGTLLISENPDRFDAYVGIGQVVDDSIALVMQKDFLEARAVERQKEKEITELREKGTAVFEKYLFKYGAELKDSKSFMPFIWSGLKSPEYTWGDVFKVPQGSSTASARMKYNVIDGSLLEEEIFDFQIPVFYFTGKFDYTTPFPLIEDYYSKVTAPYKEFVWFENSAHFPFFEEPDEFYRAMKAIKNFLNQNGAISSN